MPPLVLLHWKESMRGTVAVGGGKRRQTSSTARQGCKNRRHWFWKVFTKLVKCKKNSIGSNCQQCPSFPLAQVFAARVNEDTRTGGNKRRRGWSESRRGSVSAEKLESSTLLPHSLPPYHTPPHPRVQDGPRDGQIDGDPRGLGIRFHSEFSPSARLEGEAAELEKTLSTDR